MDDSDTTRRRYVTALGGATVTALAGCLGDSDGSGGGAGTDEDAMDGEGMDGTTEQTDTDEGGMDSSNDGGMEDTEDDTMDDSENDEAMATTFDVVVENVSDGDTLQTMGGSVAVPLSPGVYAVHTAMAHLLPPGEAAGDGLEALAEDGMPDDLANEIVEREAVLDSGAFTSPSGMDEPGPLKPGETYEFSVEASADDDPALALSTMFVQSNDLFYAPDPDGIALFEDEEPIGGEVTDEFALWDAGTEKNQPPGEGGDQAPRQSEPGAGPNEMGSVRRIEDVDDGYDYAAVDEVLRVRVSTM